MDKATMPFFMYFFFENKYINEWESHLIVEGDHPTHEAEQASF